MFKEHGYAATSMRAVARAAAAPALAGATDFAARFAGALHAGRPWTCCATCATAPDPLSPALPAPILQLCTRI